jgi:hypothetical protein
VTVRGWLSALHGPVLRCAPHRSSYEPFAGAAGCCLAVRRPRSLRSSGGGCRPPCGRPLRTRRPVRGVASAPGVDLWSGTGGESKSTAPPAGPAQGSWGVRCRAAVGLSGGWVRPVVPLAWPRRQPDLRRGRNRRRHPWVVNCALAGCTPGASPVGLRLPGEGNNRPRGETLRCARPGTHVQHSLGNPAPKTLSDPGPPRPRRHGENPIGRTAPPEPHGEISLRAPNLARASRHYFASSAVPEP